MQNYLTVNQTVEMIKYAGQKIIESKPFLTEIDSAIGDGDHGIGMEVGFKAAIKELNSQEFSTVNGVFTETGKAMIMTMGGASGVIFGTMFLSGFNKRENVEKLNLETLADAFETSLEAIKKRGKAQPGDKTMVDGLTPAVVRLRESARKNHTLLEGLANAVEGAKEGVEATKGYLGRLGRAKSLGERAIGHQDAGATSVSIIFNSMHDWVQENVG
jgi:dihydroxyacetone kinase phosphoprotein-dependent L subunit